MGAPEMARVVRGPSVRVVAGVLLLFLAVMWQSHVLE
jgi:hypothetical protein